MLKMKIIKKHTWQYMSIYEWVILYLFWLTVHSTLHNAGHNVDVPNCTARLTQGVANDELSLLVQSTLHFNFRSRIHPRRIRGYCTQRRLSFLCHHRRDAKRHTSLSLSLPLFFLPGKPSRPRCHDCLRKMRHISIRQQWKLYFLPWARCIDLYSTLYKIKIRGESRILSSLKNTFSFSKVNFSLLEKNPSKKVDFFIIFVYMNV